MKQAQALGLSPQSHIFLINTQGAMILLRYAELVRQSSHLPMGWSEQWSVLGLKAPART